jgi:23S rRNA pseudouridine1911/1915/1917 synthase
MLNLLQAELPLPNGSRSENPRDSIVVIPNKDFTRNGSTNGSRCTPPVLHREVSPSETGRIDKVVQILTKLSRAAVRGLFEHQCVSLDGKICLDAGTFLKAHSRVSVKYDPHHRYKERSQHQSWRYRIVHEDAYLLVIEKPAGILSVPTLRREKDNLVAALNIYLRRNTASRSYAAVVHRLDRDTSGLLVFGKNENIAQKLKSQFESHKPLREYRAIVAGALKKPQGTFRSYLETDEDLNQRSTQNKQVGKLAITHYEVLEILRDTTYIKVKLETGRRNQIRVHFAEIGHPVLGDERYEPRLARHPAWKHRRLALHATKLGFTHPITGKNMSFESAPGEEFENFLKSQRRK